MNQEDRKAFADIMLGLAALYDKELPPFLLDLYWGALEGWSIGEFREAAKHLSGTCTFMPKPTDFNQLRKAGRPTAGEAWARAVRHAASSAYRDGPLHE